MAADKRGSTYVVKHGTHKCQHYLRHISDTGVAIVKCFLMLSYLRYRSLAQKVCFLYIEIAIVSFIMHLTGYDPARKLPHHACHIYLNQTLIERGLLGMAPLQPTLAIPITTLDFYYRCRLHCPQFSVQQLVKALCDLANVSLCSHLFSAYMTLRQIDYRQVYHDQFSQAFDTYLQLRRRAQEAINVRLGQDSPTWRILHGCPACQYKVSALISRHCN